MRRLIAVGLVLAFCSVAWAGYCSYYYSLDSSYDSALGWVDYYCGLEASTYQAIQSAEATRASAQSLYNAHQPCYTQGCGYCSNLMGVIDTCTDDIHSLNLSMIGYAAQRSYWWSEASDIAWELSHHTDLCVECD